MPGGERWTGIPIGPSLSSGCPLRWHCQPWSVLATEEDLTFFKASVPRLGSFLSNSNDGTENGRSDLSAGYLKLLQWETLSGWGFSPGSVFYQVILCCSLGLRFLIGKTVRAVEKSHIAQPPGYGPGPACNRQTYL